MKLSSEDSKDIYLKQVTHIRKQNSIEVSLFCLGFFFFFSLGNYTGKDVLEKPPWAEPALPFFPQLLKNLAGVLSSRNLF